MSSDKQLLEACSKRCGARILYFDLVLVHFPEQATGEAGDAEALENGSTAPSVAGPKLAPPRKAYLCVGQSAVFLMRFNLSRLYPSGRIDYAWIENVVEDSSSRSRFMVVLNRDRPQDSSLEKVMVDAECRETLLSKISDNHLTDSLLRLGKLVTLPRFERDLMAPSAPSRVNPFKGFKLAKYMDYTFYIREEFEELPNAVSKVLTGVYGAPVGVLGKAGKSRSWSSWMGSGKNAAAGPQLELSLNIIDPVPLSHLAPLGQEHVRWVAMACKQALSRKRGTLVLRNQPYLKKMNLSNDIASWNCWELLLQDDDFTWAVVLLRRQYVPPMLDTVQDFVLSIKCPTQFINEGAVKIQDLTREVSVIADTFSPQLHPNIFVDIIQAKLDALLFDEDAYEWIFSRLRLRPDGEAQIEKYATIFVHGIVKILTDEHVLNSKELVEESEKLTNAVCDKVSERDMQPLDVAMKLLSNHAEGLPKTVSAGSYSAVCVNAWNFRVVRYVAHRLDGSMLGSRMTLADLMAGVHHGTVDEETAKLFDSILSFLLHLRPTDMRIPWEPGSLTSELVSMGLLSSAGTAGGDDGEKSTTGLQCMFNDRVMQALIETGFLQAALREDHAGDDCMSTKFSYLLSNLLQCDAASVNLKASVCRLIVTDKAVGDTGQPAILCGGLMRLMQTGSTFLATYACAALVNLSQSKEVVRGHLISNGIVDICIWNLLSKDHDLMLYTLMLLVHLTKTANHRRVMLVCGLLDLLYEIFSNTYQHVEHMRRVLSELCSVLGQLCNEEDARAYLSEPKWEVTRKLLEMTEAAAKMPGGRLPGQTLPETSVKTLSKALYALKQLGGGQDLQEQVASRTIPAVVRDLSNPDNVKHHDWTSNAILLLDSLIGSRKICKLLIESQWDAAYAVVSTSKLANTEIMRARIDHIETCVAAIADQKPPTGTH